MRILTAGESHGKCLTAIIEGIPSGVSLKEADVNKELSRRQKGYGRGGRMKIETDQVEITSGVRDGKTLGSPITLVIKNRDFENWQSVMDVNEVASQDSTSKELTTPRPGHADLVGGIKYQHQDLRNVLERSSARETAIRVAIGAVAKIILQELSISIGSHVVSIGNIHSNIPDNITLQELQEKSEQSLTRMVDAVASEKAMQQIDEAKSKGDTLGGMVETIVENFPAGLGSYVHYDRKLDAKIARDVMSINAFKGVEFGDGFGLSENFGSKGMDEILWGKDRGYFRKTNHLGGFEGGMSTGMPIVVRGVMKPIPTLMDPLMSVHIKTHQPQIAQVERSDTTAVPAASVVMENVVATTLLQEILDQFSSDTLEELKHSLMAYRERVREY